MGLLDMDFEAAANIMLDFVLQCKRGDHAGSRTLP